MRQKDYGPYPRPMCPQCKVFMDMEFDPKISPDIHWQCPECNAVKR